MILLIVIAFLMAGDIYTTLQAFKAGAGETNRLYDWIHKKLGVVWFVVLNILGKLIALELLLLADLWWLNVMVFMYLNYAIYINMRNARMK